MPPFHFSSLGRRQFNASISSQEFSDQWTHPSDVFSVLLILGGDVVGRALAQISGPRLSPVAFSFGWVGYSVSAVVCAIGENRLMPSPDYNCKVINGGNGYIRDNASWVIGRIVRDFESWMDRRITETLERMLNNKWQELRNAADCEMLGSSQHVTKPEKAGLCVSIYKANDARPGQPTRDWIYLSGFVVTIVQLGIAAIPVGIFGDWSIILVTTCGIALALVTGCLPQWSREKWACRRNSAKNVILTTGNGSQHAIVILGEGRGLDLEDLAAGPSNVTSMSTRIILIGLAILWILLLITAAGIKQNTWFLLAVGGIGILGNIIVAGCTRPPSAYGVPLAFHDVIADTKVMETLFAVEEKYPRLGKSMLATFFPGNLRPADLERWRELDVRTSSLSAKKNIQRRTQSYNQRSDQIVPQGNIQTNFQSGATIHLLTSKEKD